jgi:hypothetical protein
MDATATVRSPASPDFQTRALGTALRWTAYALFFMMLFVPTAYNPVKGALLGIVLVGIVVSMVLTGRLGLHRHVLVATFAFAAIGAFFIVRGHIAGAPGALGMFNVYVTWPIVYTILVAGAASRRTLRDLVRLLVVAADAVAAYSIIFVLWAAGRWPDALYYAFDQGQVVGFYGSYVEFGLYSTSTLLFVVPFLFGALLVFPKDGAPVRRWMLWVSLALNLVTVLLTGRRALLVLVPLAPAIALVFRSWLTPVAKRQSRRIVRHALWGGGALAVLAVVVIASLGGLAPAGFVDMVATGFQFDTDPVAMLRRDQFRALVTGWLDNPLLGTGHGMPASVIRSVDMPWAYELSYMALVFHTGVLGTLAYASGLLWIVATAYRAARAGWSEAPETVATLVGTTIFLAANATNPYLEKYDYLWVIFLPLAFVNTWLVERERARARG